MDVAQGRGVVARDDPRRLGVHVDLGAERRHAIGQAERGEALALEFARRPAGVGDVRDVVTAALQLRADTTVEVALDVLQRREQKTDRSSAACPVGTARNGGDVNA